MNTGKLVRLNHFFSHKAVIHDGLSAESTLQVAGLA
jgi:hypothetical protein